MWDDLRCLSDWRINEIGEDCELRAPKGEVYSFELLAGIGAGDVMAGGEAKEATEELSGDPSFVTQRIGVGDDAETDDDEEARESLL